MASCCSLRDGAHEWYCGHVGEYAYVHCKACDESTWMCAMQYGMCRGCLIAYEQSPEYQLARQEYVRQWLYERANQA